MRPGYRKPRSQATSRHVGPTLSSALQSPKMVATSRRMAGSSSTSARRSRCGRNHTGKIFVTIVAALALVGAASSALPKLQPDFYTPGYAVYCYEDYHEEALICVTPNDGFTVYMFATGRVPKTGDIDVATGNRVTNP